MLTSGVMGTIGFFFFNDTATTEIYTLSLHDPLPISLALQPGDLDFDVARLTGRPGEVAQPAAQLGRHHRLELRDRKSTRLNSSHDQISYAVFCLKKKKKRNITVIVGTPTYKAYTSIT